MNDTQTRRVRLLAVPALTLAAALGLGACGPGASAASQTTGAGGGTTAPGAGRGGGRDAGQSGVPGGRAFPGAAGLVADVTGRTAQVQSPTSQTAVSWTRTTRFTSLVSTSAAAIRVGDCVSARPERVAGTAVPTGTPSAAPSPSGPIAAATVEIFPSTSGTCTLGGPGGGPGGGFGGGFGGGGAGAAARGSGTGTPGPGAGFRAGGRGTIGTVTAVGTGTFTVAPTALRGPNGTAGTSLVPVAVQWGASTTFTDLRPATASAVTVGTCVTAIGSVDATGAVTARSLQVSRPTNGSCSTGQRFGAGGRPGSTTGAPGV